MQTPYFVKLNPLQAVLNAQRHEIRNKVIRFFTKYTFLAKLFLVCIRNELWDGSLTIYYNSYYSYGQLLSHSHSFSHSFSHSYSYSHSYSHRYGDSHSVQSWFMKKTHHVANSKIKQYCGLAVWQNGIKIGQWKLFCTEIKMKNERCQAPEGLLNVTVLPSHHFPS